MKQENTKDWKKIKEECEQDIASAIEGDNLEFSDTTLLEHPDYMALQEQLTLAEQKVEENRDKAIRAMAELENVRRRADQDVMKAHRYGLEKILSSLIPVVDSLEQALQLADKESQQSMAEGLQLTLKLFLDVLQKHDVEQINPQGDVFDPQEHEAMSMQDAPDALPNSVLMVFQKGYKLNDRIIRPARVIVAKGKPSV